MRIVTFSLVLTQLSVLVSCVHGSNVSNFFYETTVYFVRTPFKGNTSAVIIRDDSKGFSHVFERVKPQVKEIMRRKGFDLVENTTDASLVLVLGYYEEKQRRNGVDLYVGKFYISSLRQEYGERPSKYFDITSSFYKHRNPPERLIAQTYKNLVSRLGDQSFLIKKSDSKNKPGCSPRFNFEWKKNKVGQVVVTGIDKGQAFDLAGVEKGDIFLSANSLPYAEFERKENSKRVYNLNKGTRFVFIRNGKSFEKVIKPKISCSDWTFNE